MLQLKSNLVLLHTHNCLVIVIFYLYCLCLLLCLSSVKLLTLPVTLSLHYRPFPKFYSQLLGLGHKYCLSPTHISNSKALKLWKPAVDVIFTSSYVLPTLKVIGIPPICMSNQIEILISKISQPSSKQEPVTSSELPNR